MPSVKKAFVWYDPEGDFLEVTFDEKEGDMVDTADDRIMAKVDDEGHITGFHILSVNTLKGSKTKPFEVDLNSRRPSRFR
jgi:uncharacterized protein YuzE